MAVQTSKEIEATVRNIGGIEEATVPFSPGTTLFIGQNATNRTSLLAALNAALGGTQATLKTDADDGGVVLQMDDGKYTRWFERENGSVTTTGEPYTDEPELVNLYATLLEHNRVRRAVEMQGDIREVLLEPVDTDKIQSELRDHQRQRERLSNDIERAERKANDIGLLRNKMAETEEELSETENELAELVERIEEAEATEEEVEEAEKLRDRLDDLRTDLASVEDKIDHHTAELNTAKESIQRLEDEEFEVPPEEEIEGKKKRRTELKDEIESIENEIALIESVVETSRRVSNTETPLFERVEGETPVAELDPANVEVECPMCGSHVSRGEVEGHIEELTGLVTEKRQRRNELQSEHRETDGDISEMKSARREHRQHQRRPSGTSRASRGTTGKSHLSP